MDEADGNEVVSSGLVLTLAGAEIITTGRVGGALHILTSAGQYATGMRVLPCMCALNCSQICLQSVLETWKVVYDNS